MKKRYTTIFSFFQFVVSVVFLITSHSSAMAQFQLDRSKLQGFNYIQAHQIIKLYSIPISDTAGFMRYLEYKYVQDQQINILKVIPTFPEFPTPLATCTNMGFETGDFAGWTGATGYAPNGPAWGGPVGGCCTTPGLVIPGQHNIVANGGTDPCSGSTTTAPNGGGFVAQLGNNVPGWGAETLSQTWQVQPQDSLYTYWYHVVLQDPQHPLADQPFFEIIMFDQNGDTIPCSYYFVSAGNEPQNFTPSTTCGQALYKPWTPAFIPLTAYIGQNVTIRFTTVDCGQGGHWCYAYLDASCNVPDMIPPDTICEGTCTTFTSPSANGGTYSWTTGATTQTITACTPGEYQVKVTLLNGCSQWFKTTLTVNPKPVAAYTTVEGCTPVVVFDASTSTVTAPDVIATYTWNFGDGTPVINGAGSTTVTGSASNTGTYQQPTHTYTTSGTFNVTLIITTANGCKDTIVQPVNPKANPVAAFTGQNVCLNNQTCFNSSGSTVTGGVITNWDWDFGEAGATSTQQNPCRTYATPGTFNVTLVITSTGGCKDTIQHTVIVHPLPVANFSNTTVCEGDSTCFTDLSTITPPPAQIDAWSWNFGENPPGPGNISNSQNPCHTYPNDGTYTVILTVTSDSGCQSTTSKPVIVNPLPVAQFTSTPVCVGNPTPFQNTSTVAAPGTITTNSWNFGDTPAGTSNSVSPSYTYASASNPDYTVTLIVTSDMGCKDTVTGPAIVYPEPVPDFTSTPVCLGNTTVFVNNSTIASGQLNTHTWVYGDGSANGTTFSPTHPYSPAGTYIVTLTETSSFGCTKSISKPVIIYELPVADFTSTNVCLRSPTSFQELSTVSNDTISVWQWNFGVGLTLADTSRQRNPVYTYNTDGPYTVTLIVTTNKGCKDTVQKPSVVHPLPVAYFSPYGQGCSPVCVTFEDSSVVSTGNIATWNWNLGENGLTSTDQNPYNCYENNNTGTTVVNYYDVSLIVTTDQGCKDTISLDTVITVYPYPIADFVVDPQPTSVFNPTIDFFDRSLGSPVTWSWDFGDPSDVSNTATTQNAEHTYPQVATTYTATLSIVNEFGCPATTNKPVVIDPEWTFYVPNTFTPNDDGVNEVFFGTGIGIVEQEMWIYDRWGNEIAHVTGIDCSWDGKVQNGPSGELSQIDTYVWLIKIKEVFGNYHRYIGHVNLIK